MPLYTPEERERAAQRLRTLARLMDDQFTLPGTNISFGLDPLLGLIPAGGDLISAGISAYIIYEAQRMGYSRAILARMALNALGDVVLGAVPILGDAADFVFKANQKNLRLMGITPEKTAPAPRRYRVVAEQ